MTKSEIFKKAHKVTREIKNRYTNIDYKTQFSICLKFIMNDIKKVKESVKSLNYGQIKEMLLNTKKENLKEFDLMEYNTLKEKYNIGLCNKYELYRYAQLESYILPLENNNDIKAYILYIKHIETLKKGYVESLSIKPVQTIGEEKKPLRNAIRDSISKLKSLMLSPKYI